MVRSRTLSGRAGRESGEAGAGAGLGETGSPAETGCGAELAALFVFSVALGEAPGADSRQPSANVKARYASETKVRTKAPVAGFPPAGKRPAADPALRRPWAVALRR